MAFKDNLKTIRREKNISQEDLAEMLGVSRQAVSKWELGDGYPEVDKLLIISKKLNVSSTILANDRFIDSRSFLKSARRKILPLTYSELNQS